MVARDTFAGMYPNVPTAHPAGAGTLFDITRDIDCGCAIGSTASASTEAGGSPFDFAQGKRTRSYDTRISEDDALYRRLGNRED
jgi:hypothetical protein